MVFMGFMVPLFGELTVELPLSMKTNKVPMQIRFISEK